MLAFNLEQVPPQLLSQLPIQWPTNAQQDISACLAQHQQLLTLQCHVILLYHLLPVSKISVPLDTTVDMVLPILRHVLLVISVADLVLEQRMIVLFVLKDSIVQVLILEFNAMLESFALKRLLLLQLKPH